MNWDNTATYNTWAVPIANRAAKEELGRRMADMAQDGQVIGVGSGSTAYVAIQLIADRVNREHLRIAVICTSPELTMACAALDLPVATLLERRPDWAFDGADEVDPARNLIKGRGGAMFMEKILMWSSPRNFILVDQSKLVPHLGLKFPIPVEVLPVALRLVEH
jgi:ribose 5-phosphate isomerase A